MAEKVQLGSEIRTWDLSTKSLIAIASLPSIRQQPLYTDAPKVGSSQVACNQTALWRSLTNYPKSLSGPVRYERVGLHYNLLLPEPSDDVCHCAIG